MVVFIVDKSETTKLMEMDNCLLLNFFIKVDGIMIYPMAKLNKSITLTLSLKDNL